MDSLCAETWEKSESFVGGPADLRASRRHERSGHRRANIPSSPTACASCATGTTHHGAFRRALHEASAIVAIEATRDLPTEAVEIDTPL